MHHTALGGAPGAAPLAPPAGFLPLPLGRMTPGDGGAGADPAAAAAVAAMMHGMRLPLALTKKQMKGGAGDILGPGPHHQQHQGRSAGRNLSPSPEEKEGETTTPRD